MEAKAKKKPGAKISFKNLSNPFQRFRSQTGMSQMELARALGRSQVTIAGYEKMPGEPGHRAPRMPVAQRFMELAKAKKIRMTFDEIYPRKGV